MLLDGGGGEAEFGGDGGDGAGVVGLDAADGDEGVTSLGESLGGEIPVCCLLEYMIGDDGVD